MVAKGTIVKAPENLRHDWVKQPDRTQWDRKTSQWVEVIGGYRCSLCGDKLYVRYPGACPSRVQDTPQEE